jgi:hypothetical protein
MKEQRFDGPVGTYPTAEEPNFDDERTVQSARPVVPLSKIDAKLRHRRQWFLGGAFAVAMLLGAASAVISAYLKQREVPVPEVAQLDLTAAAPAPAEETLPTEAPAINEAEEQLVKPVVPKRTINTATRPRLANRNIDEPLTTPGLNEDEALERIRDSVLIDEWQERRMRRVTRRERRRTDRYNHRDLSNLDEIFEGRKRP